MARVASAGAMPHGPARSLALQRATAAAHTAPVGRITAAARVTAARGWVLRRRGPCFRRRIPPAQPHLQLAHLAGAHAADAEVPALDDAALAEHKVEGRSAVVWKAQRWRRRQATRSAAGARAQRTASDAARVGAS